MISNNFIRNKKMKILATIDLINKYIYIYIHNNFEISENRLFKSFNYLNLILFIIMIYLIIVSFNL